MKRLLAVALLAVAAPALANPGRITGTVVDPAGEPVPKATVTVRSTEVEYSRSVEADKKGRFTLAVVDATRRYEILIEKEGYVTLREPIKPVIGGVLREEFVLRPQSGGAAPGGGGVEIPEAELARLKSRNEAAKAYNAGADAFEAGDLETAATKIREATVRFAETEEQEPEEALAFEALARIELNRENWEGALAAARRLRELAPEAPLGIRMEYDALWGAKRFDEADALLEELIAQVDPNSAAVRVYNTGIEAVKVQDWDKAVARFERTIALDPEIAVAYLTLSQIQLGRGEHEAALANANLFLERQPGDPSGLQVVFNAHRAMGNTEKADEAFQRLKATDPAAVAEALMVEGRTKFNNGDVASAAGLFRNVLDLVPDHPKGHYMLGLCQASTGRLDEAKANLRRFLELAPDDPEAELARQMIAGL